MDDHRNAAIQHIGIVAGTAEGAALCYRTICREAGKLLGPHVHPEVTMHTFPLHLYLDAIQQDDWRTVAALISRSTDKLALAGADFIICPNNTLHQAFDLIDSPIPWLHLVDVVASETARRDFIESVCSAPASSWKDSSTRANWGISASTMRYRTSMREQDCRT